jgi:alpha-glucosidase (family GH31 glycosyl hydrolase)
MSGASARSRYTISFISRKGRWYNFWDDELEIGGKEIEVDAPVDTDPTLC